MTYNPAVPQPTDFISVSQGDLLTNFAQLNAIFMIDHVEYDNATAADRGKHNKATFKEQATGPTTAASETALFAQDASGAPQLFLMPQSSTDGSQVQMTYPFTKNTNGTFVLMGGIRLQWGKGTVPSGGSSVAVTFPTPFSGAPYSIVTNEWAQTQTGATARSSGPDNPTVTASGFTYKVWGGIVPANVPFGYFAIGPA